MEPRNYVDVGTPCVHGYCVHCGKALASSSNKGEVSSNSSLEALQRLNHHLKEAILFSMSPFVQINDSEGSDEYFSSRLLT